MATAKRAMGLIMGAAAGFGLVVASDAFQEEKHEPCDLKPSPEAFDVDPQAYTWFKKLEKYKKYSLKNQDLYSKALQSLDSLFHMERIIRQEGAVFGDKSLAEGHVEAFEESLNDFRQNVMKKAKNVRDEMIVEDICIRMGELAKHHLHNVYSLASLRRVEEHV